jgi:N-acetylmuramoyl-L-alanine amidase
MGRSVTRWLPVLLACCIVGSARGQQPAWTTLDAHQEGIARAEFERRMRDVYCPSGAFTNYMTITDKSVKVFAGAGVGGAMLWELRFGDGASGPATTGTNARRIRSVCLDPGHIGGEWARMEERFFVRGRDRPVQEAVLNLTVARLVKTQLEALGVTVFMTKDNLDPVTEKRPAEFRDEAVRLTGGLAESDGWPELEREAARADAVRRRQEMLFYRGAEIAARARLVNEVFKPDVTVCIHFNAAPWNERFDLVADNRLVVFTHGNYLADELADDAQKFRLLHKLLGGDPARELAVAESLASSLAGATRLPPVRYPRVGGAYRQGDSPYVYARNLAANRLFDGPVVFLEPYYMNNETVYERIQLGDYEGTRMVNGRRVKSIFREYADAVVEGLRPFLAEKKALSVSP